MVFNVERERERERDVGKRERERENCGEVREGERKERQI